MGKIWSESENPWFGVFILTTVSSYMKIPRTPHAAM